MGTKDWRVLQANNGLLYKRMGKTRQEIISKIHLSKIFLSDIFSCKLGSKELENFQLVTGEFCSLGRLKTTLGFEKSLSFWGGADWCKELTHHQQFSLRTSSMVGFLRCSRADAVSGGVIRHK